MIDRNLNLTIEGTEYVGTLVKIDKTTLGYEDHGIMTVYLSVSWGGSGTSVGGYALDQYDEDKKRRIGTAYGLEWVIQVLRVVGVSKWEDVQGKEVIMLHPSGTGYLKNGFEAVGILSKSSDEYILFKEIGAGL